MSHSFYIVLTIAAVTALIRFLPFLVFQKKAVPETVVYLGRVLPPAVIAMLVVYCMKGIRFDAAAHFMPELLAGTLTAVIHMLRRNTLLSIVSGTVCYMFLIGFVFK